MGALETFVMPAYDIETRIKACDVIISLINQHGLGPFIANSNIPEILVAQLQLDDTLRWKFAKVIKYFTRGSSAQVQSLVNAQAIPALCKSLIHFKVYDSLLTGYYKHAGPRFDFVFVNDVLSSLLSTVTTGEMLALDQQTHNFYALGLDMAAIDSIRGFLTTLRDSANDPSMNGWRNTLTVDLTSPEEQILTLLGKIKIAHEKAMNTNSELVINMLNELWNTFFATTEQVKQVAPAEVRLYTRNKLTR